MRWQATALLVIAPEWHGLAVCRSERCEDHSRAPPPVRAMISSVTFREASLADVEALVAVHVASWYETYTGILPDEVLARISVSNSAAMWRKILVGPDDILRAAIILVEEDRNAVGFGSYGLQSDQSLLDSGFSGEIGAIYILRSHQRRGIGRLLMGAMASELSGAGHFAASLWVVRENAPALAFYNKLGGTVVEERLEDGLGSVLVEKAYGWLDISHLRV